MTETLIEAGQDGCDRSAASQTTFRVVMTALARPASALPLRKPQATSDLGSLHPPVAALLLALADFETAIWLAPGLDAPRTCDVLRFETGARIVDTPAEADFAVVSSERAMPPLTAFKCGTPEYPDRSALVLVQVRGIEDAAGVEALSFQGPGIRDRAHLRVDPWPADFAAQWHANRAGFPCGVDLVFASPDSIAALPRSVRLIERT